MKELTRNEMWDQGYKSRGDYAELFFNWRNRCNVLIARKIEDIGIDGKSILEIGAGDSQWLPYLANNHPTSRFAGLDYSEAGCQRLMQRARSTNDTTSIEVFHEDMFTSDSRLHGKFDLVLSFGVVEHFSDLSRAISAKRNYLNERGLMFTLIPNMAGSVGFFARLFDREVYEMHNPHDLESFIAGHREAGMNVLCGDYLGSMSYGVLSACCRKKFSLSWFGYSALVLLSVSVGYLESKLGNLPASKFFSPYLYAVSQKE